MLTYLWAVVLRQPFSVSIAQLENKAIYPQLSRCSPAWQYKREMMGCQSEGYTNIVSQKEG